MKIPTCLKASEMSAAHAKAIVAWAEATIGLDRVGQLLLAEQPKPVVVVAGGQAVVVTLTKRFVEGRYRVHAELSGPAEVVSAH